MLQTDQHSVDTARKSRFSLAERFEHGNFDVREVCELKKRSVSGFYEDLAAGLVSIRKIGRKSVVPGPVARRYLDGEPQPADDIELLIAS